MLPIAPARTNREWEGVQSLPGVGGEDNLGWLGRATQTLTSQFGDALKSQELVRLVLFGGTDPVSFRLRVAQAHIRHDMTPVVGPHVVLIHPKQLSRVYEISLGTSRWISLSGFDHGLPYGSIQHYRDRARFPNIALLGSSEQRQADMGGDQPDIHSVSKSSGPRSMQWN